ncbi:MAG TPA: glucose-6-phosphate isomerase [Phycisphaerae bacterium]|nr:glucose-6-phosphate isomerase [Phycisphaerae bacterium]
MTPTELWERYRRYLCVCESIGLSVDISRMPFADDFLGRMAPAMSRAFDAMEALEAGAIANPDENRRVGHYWLRAPDLAPEPAVREEIEQTLQRVKSFAADVHAGRIPGQSKTGRGGFANLLLIGIGGSALGPQFVADALGNADDPLRPYFLDNTDPDGFDRVFDQLGGDLDRTLVIVVSKSGSTVETRNAMLEAIQRYEQAGLNFADYAVAVTQSGSALDRRSTEERWLTRFPMWDWVGGRTSVTSAVGLLPAALQGFDVGAILAGARDADVVTRSREVMRNPAALLALMWYHATEGRGAKDMVVIPYKDRLALFPKYLQQLVMESLGKERDLDGRTVQQGLTVYGNKGSTDQHAYVQQLREGVDNFFVTFIGVRRDRSAEPSTEEAEATSGDYLHGFLLGTREALHEMGRQSITITLDESNARSVGVLIALYERAVGLYASLINVNAYHQPGVEAGKKAATAVIELQRRILAELAGSAAAGPRTAQQIAEAIGAPDQLETVHHVLEHLAANPGRGVVATTAPDATDIRYSAM